MDGSRKGKREREKRCQTNIEDSRIMMLIDKAGEEKRMGGMSEGGRSVA